MKLIFRRLHAHFGPQHWWPAESAFEVMVGAILTQNTNWLNVERAINNLKKEKALEPRRLKKLSPEKLARLISPAGYYNIKAKRLKEFVNFFTLRYGGKIENMLSQDACQLRKELLSVYGIGPETADSMLLYALDKPVFVVDAYTKRVFSRHGLIKENASYDQVQGLFMQNLKTETRLFNEYHALIVRLGKDFCWKNKPKCNICPLH